MILSGIEEVFVFRIMLNNFRAQRGLDKLFPMTWNMLSRYRADRSDKRLCLRFSQDPAPVNGQVRLVYVKELRVE